MTKSPGMVEMGQDGMPADPGLRRHAVKLKFHLSRQRNRIAYDSKWLLKSLFPGQKLNEGKAVWRALLSAKTVVKDSGGFRFANPGRLDPVDTASRRANFEAVAIGVAGRACSSPKSVAKCRSLFMRVRTLYGIHRISAGNGRAVLFPARLGMGPDGPEIAEAGAVLVMPDGLKACRVPRHAILQSFEDDKLSMSVFPSLCEDDAELQALLESWRISPFTSQPSDLPGVVARTARQSVAALHGFRSECSAFVGEELSPKAWKSFMASLRRVPPLGTGFTRTVFGTLDPETRKAAMRNPAATGSLYNWLCGGPDGRRLQASVLFPVLTERLPAAEAAIDAGRELLPALSAATGFPVPVLRRMGGLTWQKLGRDFRLLVEGSRGDGISSLLSEIDPSRTPVTAAEWIDAGKAASALGRAFGWPLPGSLAEAASKDWADFARLVDAGFVHAVEDVAQAVATAATGKWSEVPRGSAETAYARAVASAVAGDGGGMKRLETFNAKWHRDQAGMTASMRRVRRRVFGESTASWKPLVASGRFDCPEGSLEFLCDEDAIAVEGVEMKHCVGSYAWACVSGRSHVAAVRSATGRSTVEFSFAEGRLETVQHMATSNRVPSAGCMAAVAAFEKAARTGKAELQATEEGENAEAVQSLASREALMADVAEEDALEILRIHSDCLPRAVRGLGPKEWRSLASACGGWRRGDDGDRGGFIEVGF